MMTTSKILKICLEWWYTMRMKHINWGLEFEKNRLRYSKDDIRQREYMCSKEGFPQDSDHLDDKKFKKLQIRTSCEASIRFTVTYGEWKPLTLILNIIMSLQNQKKDHF